MLSNRRSLLGGPVGGPMSVDKTNPNRQTWCRRASSFTVAQGTYGSVAPPVYNSTPSDGQPHCQSPSVLTSTTPEIPGHRIVRVIGSVYGNTTAALPKDGVKMWLKTACGMGAEVRSLTNIIYQARDAATDRMVIDCVSRGGNAIIGMSFTECEIAGCATVSAQGTAVYIELSRELPEDPFKEE
ncbi:hypothetical protein DHEL01_v202551 [Diaporthe helianthi]|uniref:Uncharacterized protein n=1 Tax=Diaporthe helianthi TaxID=158607 RepID=A0A2P5I996_DIAHE|nr:hypothetical protein DHEL01_v202551 [Diaporthe helianthi]